MTYEWHWGTMIDTEEPIFGVVNANHLEHLGDEMNNAIDLWLEEGWTEYFVQRKHAWHLDGNKGEPDENLVDEWRAEYDSNNEGYYDSTVYLIGNWKYDAEILQYVPNTDGVYAATYHTDHNTIVVEWSKWAIRCALCSPCYPGRGDLDTEGKFLVYDMPPAVYGNYRENTNTHFALGADNNA